MSKVYVIKCVDTGLCKIGRSFDVKERVKQISYACGFNCEIAYESQSLLNPSKVEVEAHRICNGRKVGEWFSCSTNEAIACVKSAIETVGLLGSNNIKCVDDCNLDFLVFWSVSESFIKSSPLAVIKYALDTFDSHFSENVLAVCNRAYSIGAGGDVDGFVDRLDVQCFYDEMVKQK